MSAENNAQKPSGNARPPREVDADLQRLIDAEEICRNASRVAREALEDAKKRVDLATSVYMDAQRALHESGEARKTHLVRKV